MPVPLGNHLADQPGDFLEAVLTSPVHGSKWSRPKDSFRGRPDWEAESARSPPSNNGNLFVPCVTSTSSSLVCICTKPTPFNSVVSEYVHQKDLGEHLAGPPGDVFLPRWNPLAPPPSSVALNGPMFVNKSSLYRPLT